MDRYDIIIAGAGAAGLSLAYHLARAGCCGAGQSILLIDREPKHADDRTWCFWEQGDSPYESIVYRQWRRAAFFSPSFSAVLDLAPYRYKMIRGGDFYRFMDGALRQCPGLAWQFGAVEAVEEEEDGAVVRVDGRRFAGRWVFNSLALNSPPRNEARYHYLLQHFEGWVVETGQPAFDPAAATLMDFRIEQRGQARFVYVLPFDERRALVEYTVFSRDLLPRAEYAAGLEAYLRDVLRAGRYTVTHREFGVIPMTDAPFQYRPSPHVIAIGTAGGRTKPSTGYTFLRIQEQSRAIAAALRDTGRPFHRPPPGAGRFSLYDGVLLNILDRGRYPGHRVFANLFRRNRPAAVIRFLDETPAWHEELGVLARTYYPPFVAATWDVLRRRLAAS